MCLCEIDVNRVNTLSINRAPKVIKISHVWATLEFGQSAILNRLPRWQSKRRPSDPAHWGLSRQIRVVFPTLRPVVSATAAIGKIIHTVHALKVCTISKQALWVLPLLFQIISYPLLSQIIKAHRQPDHTILAKN